ncbi:plastocyanin/azurin family copper-binding protein [Halomicroarcula sp. GCM10025709]|uniref:plastocyanin/azurin family copper-binding protein n=1 Tax=Halomicroarcula sp. GCM10025709 TaxID=3252669 RepID=UPI003613B2F7
MDSGSLASSADTTYSHTFETEGTYRYVCTPHEGLGMKGAVVVRPGAPSGDGTAGASQSSTESTASQQTAGGTETAAGERNGADGGGSATGPLGALATVIVMAFLSPLAFAALMRRQTGE